MFFRPLTSVGLQTVAVGLDDDSRYRIV